MHEKNKENRRYMKIAIRIDDITPDMDWKSFYAFKELLDSLGVKPLLGVVPDNKDVNLQKEEAREDFWEIIQSLQDKGWSIAVHGAKHVYTTKKGGLFPLNHFSEFAGVPYEEQKKLLMNAVSTFQKRGIKTDTFMAPGHSYDQNTLQILKSLGFRYMTDGFSDTPYIERKSQLTFLPIAFQRSKDVQKEKGYTTLVYHINGMKEETLAGYKKELMAHREQLISYEELCNIPPVKQTCMMRIKEKLMAHLKHYMVMFITKK